MNQHHSRGNTSETTAGVIGWLHGFHRRWLESDEADAAGEYVAQRALEISSSRALSNTAASDFSPRKGPGTFPEVEDILGSFPPPPRPGGILGRTPVSSFSLHKLHGSTTWFRRLDSSDLLSIVRFDSLVPHWGKETPGLDRGLAALKDTLSPMILLLLSLTSLFSTATRQCRRYGAELTQPWRQQPTSSSSAIQCHPRTPRSWH